MVLGDRQPQSYNIQSLSSKPQSCCFTLQVGRMKTTFFPHIPVSNQVTQNSFGGLGHNVLWFNLNVCLHRVFFVREHSRLDAIRFMLGERWKSCTRLDFHVKS